MKKQMKTMKTMKTMKKRYRRKNVTNHNNKYKHRFLNKQIGGISGVTATTAENIMNDYLQGQMVASSTDQAMNQSPGDGVVDVINASGDDSTDLGSSINNVYSDGSFTQPTQTTESTQSTQPIQPNSTTEKLQKYLQYMRNNPSFIQSTLLNLVVKPAAVLIDELGKLLNMDMNNPEKVKLELDEMANSIQDPEERNKILNYNAQVLAVYLTASKPSIDIISGIFSQEITEIMSDFIYNMYNELTGSIQKMVPILALPSVIFNDIPLMLISIIQAMTTITQLAANGYVSTQESVQRINKSIMKKADANMNLAIEEQKKADILEKQNKLVQFILEKPEIIDSYVKYLNKVKQNNTTELNGANNNNMVGGNKKHTNLNKERLLNEIKKSLHEYTRSI